MNMYAIFRRSGWQSPEELQAAAGRSGEVGNNEMSDDVRWIRTYVLAEDNGSLGAICIYQATSPEAMHAHAAKANLPITEVIPIADTVVIRPDPGAAEG